MLTLHLECGTIHGGLQHLQTAALQFGGIQKELQFHQ
jgi:hypothetical protein